MANHEKINSNSGGNSKWDEVAKMAKESKLEQAKHFYGNIREFQKSFETRSRNLKASGDSMSQKEFEKWEDLAGDELKLAERERDKQYLTIEERAECEQNMVATNGNVSKTIEAQAGNYYYERMDSLKQAIEKEGNENSEEELNYLKDFYPAVVKHLDFKYMTQDDIQSYGYEEYDRKRTRTHNEVIKHLNGINDLARKYHVRPLTFRNFWSSDLVGMDAQTPAISKMMSNDRHTVEEYYEIAFSSEVRRRKAKLERDSFRNYI